MTGMLQAVFDFADCRDGQDVFSFLLLAEMAREKSGRAGIHAVLVADRDMADDASALFALSASLMLMPSVRGYSLCASRAEAVAILATSDEPVFPTEIGNKPPQCASATARGDFAVELDRRLEAGCRIPCFEVPAQAEDYVGAWMEAVAGQRRVVTIMPNLDDTVPKGGEQGEAWAAILDALDPAAYCPVAVVDARRLGEPLPGRLAELPAFPGAGPLSPLRFALYKRAHVNLFEGRSALGLCRAATDLRCIGVAIPSDTVPASSSPTRCFVTDPVSGEALIGLFRKVDAAIAAGGDPARPGGQPRAEVMSLDEFFKKALRLQAMGGAGLAQAVAICRGILQSRPRHHGALGLLGINALCVGRLDDAVDLLRLAAEIAREEPAHYYNLGNALTALGRSEEAAAAYKSVLLVDPGFDEAWESLGANYQARNRFAEAAECYGRLLKAGSRSIRLLFDHAHCLAALGRHEEAAESYLAAGNRNLSRQDKHECANVMSGGCDRRIYAPRNARFPST